MQSILNSGTANSVDPDQTAPIRAVWSGSTLFACAILSFEILGHLTGNHFFAADDTLYQLEATKYNSIAQLVACLTTDLGIAGLTPSLAT